MKDANIATSAELGRAFTEVVGFHRSRSEGEPPRPDAEIVLGLDPGEDEEGHLEGLVRQLLCVQAEQLRMLDLIADRLARPDIQHDTAFASADPTEVETEQEVTPEMPIEFWDELIRKFPRKKRVIEDWLIQHNISPLTEVDTLSGLEDVVGKNTVSKVKALFRSFQ